MFELARLHDTVHIQPADFAKNLLAAVTDFLNEKYPNKVCVCVCVCACARYSNEQLEAHPTTPTTTPFADPARALLSLGRWSRA